MRQALSPRKCCVCDRLAMGVYGQTPYCIVHRPSTGRAVTVDDVLHARLGLGCGDTLKSIAAELGVFTSDLDLAMWRAMGQELRPKRYVPDFIA